MATVEARTLALQSPAAELGQVYQELRRLHPGHTFGQALKPKGQTTIRNVGSVQDLDSKLLPGLRAAYGNVEQPAIDRYAAAYYSVFPWLAQAAHAAAMETLTAQIAELAKLGTRLAQVSIADQLHDIALGVRERMGGDFSINLADHYATKAALPKVDETAWMFQEARRANYAARWRAALAEELAAQVAASPNKNVTTGNQSTEADSKGAKAEKPAARTKPETEAKPGTVRTKEACDLIRVLSLHPGFASGSGESSREPLLLNSYARSAKEGDLLAHRFIGQAIAATGEFGGKLRANPEHVLRYPPLIVLGVRQLGLHELRGFPEYAVDLGQALTRDSLDELLSFLGLVVFCLGVVFTGPLAAVAIGVADLALTGTSAVFTYLKEREAELGATGADFRTEGRVAEHNNYSGTAMGAAATLLAGIGLVFAGISLAKHVRAGKSGVPLPTAPHAEPIDLAPRIGDFPSVPENKYEAFLDRSTGVATRTKHEIDDVQRGIKGETKRGLKREDIFGSRQNIDPRTLKNRQNKAATGDVLRETGARELDPATLEESHGTAGKLNAVQLDPHDFGNIPESALSEPADVTKAGGPGSFERSAPAQQIYDKASIAREPYRPQELKEIERANKQGRKVAKDTDRYLVTKQDQIAGIISKENWERARGKTPTAEQQQWAQQQLPKGAPDPILPSVKTDLGSADHIVAVELIKQFPGFTLLTEAEMIHILNMQENMMAVSLWVNVKRGSKPYSALTHIGDIAVPPAILAAMREKEKAVAVLIQRRIDDLLKQKALARGLEAPPRRRPPPPLGSLWVAIGAPDDAGQETAGQPAVVAPVPVQ